SYIQVRSAAARLPSAAAQRSTLFPYTTLFRSRRGAEPDRTDHAHLLRPDHLRRQQATETAEATHRGQRRKRSHHPATTGAVETRSEEHTSELQSRENLVCRLLLEKKTPTPK